MRAERKELFSEKVSAGSRTYFFNVKGPPMGKSIWLSMNREEMLVENLMNIDELWFLRNTS